MKLVASRVIVCFFVLSTLAVGQDYLTRVGRPTFSTPEPVELGFIDLSNGNLHLEIELGSFPQRGRIPYSARLIYDSRIWKVVNNAWQPTNVANSWGGWRFAAIVSASLYVTEPGSRRRMNAPQEARQAARLWPMIRVDTDLRSRMNMCFLTESALQESQEAQPRITTRINSGLAEF